MDMQSTRPKVRKATIIQRDGRPTLEEVSQYVYHFVARQEEGGGIVIEGVDDHGFTLDAIIDRLASGIITARETTGLAPAACFCQDGIDGQERGIEHYHN